MFLVSVKVLVSVYRKIIWTSISSKNYLGTIFTLFKMLFHPAWFPRQSTTERKAKAYSHRWS